MVTDPFDPSASNSISSDDAAGPEPVDEDDHTGNSPTSQKKRAYHRDKRGAGPESPARTLTTKEIARILRVVPLWLWQHRDDPDFPKPLRLGPDPTNPRAPLRWLESDLVAYLKKKQAETNIHRVGNLPRGDRDVE
jgi:predicted DNA-binding transcriptional regulator AlpA